MEVLEGEIGHGTGKLNVYAQFGVKVEVLERGIGHIESEQVKSIPWKGILVGIEESYGVYMPKQEQKWRCWREELGMGQGS